MLLIRIGAVFRPYGLDISGARYVSGQIGQSARLGIRPQHLSLDPKGPLGGQVSLVERLGTETVVELVDDQGAAFRCVSQTHLDLALGDRARFSFDPADAHIFG